MKRMKRIVAMLLVVTMAFTMAVFAQPPKEAEAASLASEVKNAVKFGVDFYKLAKNFCSVSEKNASLNHVRNVKLCGDCYYNKYIGNRNINNVITYVTENNLLKPVNFFGSKSSSVTKQKMQEYVAAYIVSCVYDYDCIMEGYYTMALSASLHTPIFKSRTSLSNSNLTGYGQAIVNKSHVKTSGIFIKKAPSFMIMTRIFAVL